MSLIARGAALLSAVLLVAELAAAGDAAPVTLRWDAPPGCPSEGDVLVQITRMLAGRARPAERLVTARVREDGERWRVSLETVADGQRSRRDLEASTCAAVAEATALVVAVSIDPELAIDPAPAEAAAPPISAAEPATDGGAPGPAPAEAAAPRAIEAPVPARATVAWGVHAGAGAVAGLTPALGGALHGGAFVARGALGARLDAHLLLPVDARDDATFGALRVRAVGCRDVLGASRVHLAPCAGLEADVLWGRGRGVSEPRAATAGLFALSLALGASFDVSSWLALGIDGDVALPLQRPSFELAGRPVFRVAPILGAGRAEARVRW